MQAVNVKTPAVMCRECTSSIEVAVASIPGVIGVTVSVAGGNTSVMFDEARTSSETVVAAIRSAGFDVEAD